LSDQRVGQPTASGLIEESADLRQELLVGMEWIEL
jgi:hypothetical protein